VRRRGSSRKAAAGALLTLLFGLWVADGCVDLAPNTVPCPPLEDFKAVSPLLEKKCGTLDCHGNDARPLRLYSQYGLRFLGGEENTEQYSGNLAVPTTPEEIERNYFAMCGLEPEKTSFVTAGEEQVETLTIVRKPRLTEKHKGGRIWNEGKVDDRCLTVWIEGDYEPGEMDTQDCVDAVSN